MRGDIFYEVKYLIHCIMYKGIGNEFCWVPTHCGLYWNEISDKLAKQGAMKNISEVSSNNLLLSSHEINSLLKKTVYKQIEKSKFAIPSAHLSSHKIKDFFSSRIGLCTCTKPVFWRPS